MIILCPICDSPIKVSHRESSYRCYQCGSWLRKETRLTWDREKELAGNGD